MPGRGRRASLGERTASGLVVGRAGGLHSTRRAAAEDASRSDRFAHPAGRAGPRRRIRRNRARVHGARQTPAGQDVDRREHGGGAGAGGRSGQGAEFRHAGRRTSGRRRHLVCRTAPHFDRSHLAPCRVARAQAADRRDRRGNRKTAIRVHRVGRTGRRAGRASRDPGRRISATRRPAWPAAAALRGRRGTARAGGKTTSRRHRRPVGRGKRTCAGQLGAGRIARAAGHGRERAGRTRGSPRRGNPTGQPVGANPLALQSRGQRHQDRRGQKRAAADPPELAEEPTGARSAGTRPGLGRQPHATCLVPRKAAQAERDILRAESQLAELYLRKERFTAEAAGHVQQRDAWRSKRPSSPRTCSGMRGKIRKLEARLHAKELAAGEVRHERTTLVDRLREDYGIELAAARTRALGRGAAGARPRWSARSPTCAARSTASAA